MNKPHFIAVLEQVHDVDLSQFDLTQFDIDAVNEFGENSLMYYFEHKERYGLFFSEKQLNYLTENSNLEQRSNRGVNVILLLLKNKAKQNLNVNARHIDNIVKRSFLNFKKIEILDQALIYDFRFPQDLNAKHWRKIVNCCLEPDFEEEQTNKLCAMLCVTNNFAKIFKAIDNKEGFISFLRDHKSSASCALLYKSHEIQYYIEKKHLEESLSDIDSKGGVSKI